MPQTGGSAQARQRVGLVLSDALWRTCGYDLDGEGMHPVPQFIRQRFVDGAVLGNARQPAQGRGGDADTEMRLPFRTRSRMPLMS